MLKSKCCRTCPSLESSSTTLSERLLATSNLSLPLSGNHGQSGGIWNRGSGGGFTNSEGDLLAGGNVLRRDFQKAFRGHFAIFKFVHCDAVAGIASLRPRGVGD